MTHFDNYEERQVFQAISLLKDDNLVWSSDMDAIRINLAYLLERLMQIEWRFLEPEIGDLAISLVREANERENDARRYEADTEETILQGEDNPRNTRAQGSGNSCCCCCK